MFVVVLALVFRFWQSRNSSEQPLVAQTQNVPAPIKSPIANATPEALAGSPKNGGGETLPRRPKTDKSPAVGVRSAQITAAGPRLLSPGEGSVMDADKLTVSWNPVATATFYETSIVSAAGDPVFQARTEATHLRLPAEVKLVRGAKYFVWVSATLEEGKTVKSNMVSFRAR